MTNYEENWGRVMITLPKSFVLELLRASMYTVEEDTVLSCGICLGEAATWKQLEDWRAQFEAIDHKADCDAKRVYDQIGQGNEMG